MRKYFLKNKKQSGYALLFAILIISAISVVTAGLINTVYKQLVLSLLAKDSSLAFYQADTAVDCAMYADLYAPAIANDEEILKCGGFELKVDKKNDGSGSYDLLPPNGNSKEPCFRISINRTADVMPGSFKTKNIQARGYNVCDMSSPRVVEREIVVDFDEE